MSTVLVSVIIILGRCCAEKGYYSSSGSNVGINCLLLQLDEDEDFVDALNPCTKKEIAAFGDSNMRNLKQGDILQLERKGYFRCDVPFVRPSKPMVLFAIPDGRQQTK